MANILPLPPEAGAYRGAAAAMRLLAQETRVSRGPIPHALGGEPVPPASSCLVGDSFLLRTDSGLGFFYRRGEGITVEYDPGSDLAEAGLWLHGSVYTAVACINGLMPIHASAVARDGRVHAFTGPSGAGKSTLVAALAARGLTLYADDTLVLDLSDPAQIVCLPGHKQLKLTPEAIAATAARPLGPVGADTGKFYATAGTNTAAGDEPADPTPLQPLPLAELVFLETGDALAITPITGGACIARLSDDHYTTDLFVRARNRGRGEIFALRARLARQLAMSLLVRPRDMAHFADSVTLAAGHIASQGVHHDGSAGGPESVAV